MAPYYDLLSYKYLTNQQLRKPQARCQCRSKRQARLAPTAAATCEGWNFWRLWIWDFRSSERFGFLEKKDMLKWSEMTLRTRCFGKQSYFCRSIEIVNVEAQQAPEHNKTNMSKVSQGVQYVARPSPHRHRGPSSEQRQAHYRHQHHNYHDLSFYYKLCHMSWNCSSI